MTKWAVSQECKIDIQKAIYVIQRINRINGKSMSFIFINSRKTFEKNQHEFMIKLPND